MGKLGIGIVGCGVIAQAHAQGYHHCPDVEIRALADTRADVLERVGGQLGVGALYADYRDLLARPDVDAVSICTPNALHHEQFLAAVAAGKHVCVEKPMGISVAQAGEMRDAASRAGLISCVGLPVRYYPSHRKIKQMVESGRVGEVVVVKQTFGYDFVGLVAREQARTWYVDVALSGGGMLMTQTIHYLDLLTWLLPSPVVAVTAQTWRSSPAVPPEFDTNVIATLELASGGRALIENNWTAAYHEPGLEIYGTEGTIVATDSQPYPAAMTVTYYPRQSPLPDLEAGRGHGIVVGDPVPLGRPPEGHNSVIADFVASIRAGSAQGDLPTTDHGYRLQVLIEAGYRSSREGRRVAVDLARGGLYGRGRV